MPAQLLSYQCPHCGHLIEVDPAAVDKIVNCPNPECGKPFHPEVPSVKPVPTLIVPPSVNGESPHEEPAAQAVAQPPKEPAEHEVLTVRPEMFRRYPFRFVGYNLMIVVGLAVLLWGLLSGYHALTVLGVVALGFGGYRLLAWWLRNRATAVKITNKRLILQVGALACHSTEIAHKDITDVQVHENLFNRLLDVGDIILFTKLEGKKEILVLAVRDPEKIAGLLRQFRQP